MSLIKSTTLFKLSLYLTVTINQAIIAQAIIGQGTKITSRNKDYFDNISSHHTSFGLGIFYGHSPYSSISSWWVSDILPSIYFSSEYLFKKSMFFELNMDYQQNTKFEKGTKRLGHFRSNFVIGYGFFKYYSDSFFNPTKVLDFQMYNKGDSRVVETTYSGQYVNYTYKSGLVIGIGAMYFRSHYDKELSPHTDYSNNSKTQELWPMLEFKYIKHSLGTKKTPSTVLMEKDGIFTTIWYFGGLERPIYRDIYLKLFHANNSIGFDIGLEMHALEFNNSYFWRGHRIGFKNYRGLWNQENQIKELYWQFILSFH